MNNKPTKRSTDSIKNSSKNSGIVHLSAFEPLLPSFNKEPLAELTSEILRKAGALSAQIPSSIVRGRVAGLVREMNSYYSNLIEGHKTLPRDIEKALENDFSEDPRKRASQQLNRAHIEVEELMFRRLKEEPNASIHSAEFLCWLHKEFYLRLPEEQHWSADRQEKNYKIEAGKFRSFEVKVGSHIPPSHQTLPKFIERFGNFYGSNQIIASEKLIAIAAAHHRLAWIHPFGDGNGRVARLYSHACIARAQVDSFGLWTLSRGLARQRQEYFQCLSAADQKRWNDLDGRGTLTDRGLTQFCNFFLRAMLDQIEFMESLLGFETLAARIERHLQFELLHLKAAERERLSRLLRAALLSGEIERGSVGEIVGLSSTSARGIIRLALDEKLLESPSPKGQLLLAFSSRTLESYFPKLYQDLPV